jgi:hypothetical protein
MPHGAAPLKTYGTQQGVSMLELLQEGFPLVKEREGE